MELMVIFFMAAFAMGGANQCFEDKAEDCVETLLASILGDSTEEEVCSELTTSIDCLRETVSQCDIDDDEVEEGMAELEKVLKDNCEGGGEDENDEEEKMKECFQTNEDYIYECIFEGSSEAMAVQMEKEGELDENELQCTMYSMIAGCFVDRIGEKCGEEAARLAKTEMDDLPEEIAEACEKSGDIHVHDIQLIDKKK